MFWVISIISKPASSMAVYVLRHVCITLEEEKLLHSVVLLNSINVKPLKLHYRFNVTLQSVELPQPSNFSSSFGLLGYLRQFMVIVVEKSSWSLKTMDCSLSQGPLCLSFTSSIILLCCESGLVLNHGIPGLATQCISDYELENIKREVSDYAEKPRSHQPIPSQCLGF